MNLLAGHEINTLSTTEPGWADQDPDTRLAMPVDLRNPRLSDGEIRKCVQWLKRQPIPVIGIVSPEDTAWHDGIDLMVPDENACEELIGHIEQQPLACAVLTQVTRVTSVLPVHDALVVESLAYSTLQAGESFRQWLATRNHPAESIVDNPVSMTRDAGILKIELNSPQNRNALSMAMRDALSEAFRLVVMDPDITLAQVTGRGPAFCAGGDLKEFGLSKDAAEAHRVRLLRMPGQFVAIAPDKFHFYLHGACVGAGIELPAFARHITADPDSWFQLPEVGFGLIPGAGGCVSLPRRIGRHRTNLLALSGRRLNADQALAWGLVDELKRTDEI